MSENNPQAEIDENEWNTRANWRLGLFYYSETDSRAWVPKRSMLGRRRFGGTLNFAKPQARRYFYTMLAALLGLFLILVILGQLGMGKA